MMTGRKSRHSDATQEATLGETFEIVGPVALSDSAIEALTSLLIDAAEKDASVSSNGRSGDLRDE